MQTSGTCGENLKWAFNGTTKILTISGIGPMTDFTMEDWSDYTGANAIDSPWLDIKMWCVKL